MTNEKQHKFEYEEIKPATWAETRDRLFAFRKKPRKPKKFKIDYVFRGHADATWPLSSTIERLLRPPGQARQAINYFGGAYHKGREFNNVERFRMACHHHMSSEYLPDENDSFFEWLAILQHHGAPTRLLDVTASPFVAVFFAVSNLALRNKQGCIWAIDIAGLADSNIVRFGELFGRRIEYNADQFDSVYNERFMDKTRNDAIVAFYNPRKATKRSLAQKASFILTLDNNYDFEETISRYPNTDVFIKKIVLPKFSLDDLSGRSS